MGIFSAAAWNTATAKGGLGFILIDSNAKVCHAEFGPSDYDSNLEIEIKALNLALLHSIEAREQSSNVYISSAVLWKAIHHMEEEVCWRQMHSIDHLRELLQLLNHPQVELIPHH